jgi:hypothetical protein
VLSHDTESSVGSVALPTKERSSHRGRRRPLIAAALGALLLAAGSAVVLTTTPDSQDPQGPGPRPQGVVVGSFTSPVPENPRLDPHSRAMVAHLATKAVVNADEYGFPVYEADASTPRYAVRCTKDWGTCRLQQAPVPIPDRAVPSPGSDGAMVVVDRAAGVSYEFWQARKVGPVWLASWGDVTHLAEAAPSEATGAGLSILDGLVTPAEVAAGVAEHALTFSTDHACATRFRVPATKTDGLSTRGDCIPEGSRVRLSPSVDIAAIPHLSRVERMIATALQRYGAYVRDRGGSPITFSFQTPADPQEQETYRSAGLVDEYTRLDHIPWDELQVLANWDGS